MAVDHRVDVGPAPVDRGVDVELERGRVRARNAVSVEVDLHQVRDGQMAADGAAGVDQQPVRPSADGAVAVVVDDPGLREHADGVHEEVVLHHAIPISGQ